MAKTTASTRTLQSDLKKTADDAKKTATEAVTLAKTTADAVQKDIKETAGDVKESVGKIFLAGLGAFSMAEEEGSKMFKKLVKKGQKVELKGLGGDQIAKLRASVDAGVEKVSEQTDKVTDAVMDRANDARYVAGEAAGKFEDRVQEAVAVVMKRVGVPTREEIAELTSSVERLTKHIEKLKEERAAKVQTPELFSVGGGWYELRVGEVVVEKVQGKENAEQALARLLDQQ